jgi:RNA polymerase sigma-B factor
VFSQTGRQPTVAELCAATGESEEAALDALEAARAYRATSLDLPLADGDGEPLSSVLGDREEGFDEVEARVTVESAARALTNREREVWLHVDEDLTQDAIAKRLGISQMQVSRDLSNARRRLRESLELPDAGRLS